MKRDVDEFTASDLHAPKWNRVSVWHFSKPSLSGCSFVSYVWSLNPWSQLVLPWRFSLSLISVSSKELLRFRWAGASNISRQKRQGGYYYHVLEIVEVCSSRFQFWWGFSKGSMHHGGSISRFSKYILLFWDKAFNKTQVPTRRYIFMWQSS